MPSYHMMFNFSSFGRGLYFYQKQSTKNGITNVIITADITAADFAGFFAEILRY